MTKALPLPDVPRDRLSVEFFLPAPALRPYVSGYNVYGTFGPEIGGREFFIPGWSTVRFTMSRQPWIMQFGGEPPVVVPSAAVFGPSISDIRCDGIPEGISAGFGITPLGVHRLLGLPADRLAGRLAPLSMIWPDAAALQAGIAALPGIDAIAGFFDEALLARLRPPSPDEPLVAALMDLLVRGHDTDVAAAAHHLGCSESKLRRVAHAHFGFAPKILLRRSRFLKSLLAIYGREPGSWSRLIDASYVDQSHFIKDAREFLGCTPGEFLRYDRPMTQLSMRRRAEVLGAPLMAIHRPAG